MNVFTRKRYEPLRTNDLHHSFKKNYSHPLYWSHSNKKFRDQNLDNVSAIIDYLTYLKNNGKLSEKEFFSMVTNVCACFVENEMNSMIDEFLISSLADL